MDTNDTTIIELENLLDLFRGNCRSVCMAETPCGSGWRTSLYYEGRKAVLGELIENLYGSEYRSVMESIENEIRTEVQDRYGIAYH